MDAHDDDLKTFEARGPLPLPTGGEYLDHDGVRLWFASFGSGPPVLLLHGGMGNAGNWGYQVPALVDRGYRVLVMDTRGHGRSTRDHRPYSYETLATDALAVLDHAGVPQASLVGWSDGACTALVLASRRPDRVSGVLFFACNMDPSGAKEFVFTDTIGRCLARHQRDYLTLSPTPDQFDAVFEAVGLMQRTQPNFTAADLAAIHVPVTVVHSEHDEFIRPDHARYLADTIPGARFVLLPEVSHFAPVQRPGVFHRAVLDFLTEQGGSVSFQQPRSS